MSLAALAPRTLTVAFKEGVVSWNVASGSTLYYACLRRESELVGCLPQVTLQ